MEDKIYIFSCLFARQQYQTPGGDDNDYANAPTRDQGLVIDRSKISESDSEGGEGRVPMPTTAASLMPSLEEVMKIQSLVVTVLPAFAIDSAMR